MLNDGVNVLVGNDVLKIAPLLNIACSFEIKLLVIVVEDELIVKGVVVVGTLSLQ